MARQRSRRSKEETYTLIGVRVADYQVRAEAHMNTDLRSPQYAIAIDDNDPVFKHVTHLTISGIATYPKKHADHRYEIAVYGDDAPSRGVFVRLTDVQVRGEYGERKYRQYRGGNIPVFKDPLGFGVISKVRGEPAWTAWLNVAPRLVSDMLVLLCSKRDLYLAIDERKIGRTRWVRGLSLQTTDPADE